MIARFRFVIPKPFHLQCAGAYEPIELEKAGYRIVIHAPVTSEFEMYPPLENNLTALEMASMVRPSEESLIREDLTVDGEPSIEASLLQIDFHAENFERSVPLSEAEPASDPPMEFVLGIVNELLTAIRLLGRAGEIKTMTTPGMWSAHYLDDHANPLPRDGKNVLGHYGAHVERTVNSMTQEMWRRLPELLAELNPPSWRSLLLDAQAILPEAGAAVILIATALEVLIATVLRHRADQSKVSADTWNWLSESGERRKHPSLEERFDTLLEEICGVSMKHEKPEFWSAFKMLKNARNHFAHSGRLVQRKDGKPLTVELIGGLIQKASEIATWLESFLPEEMGNKRFTLERYPKLAFEVCVKGPTDPESAVVHQIVSEWGPRADR